MSLDNKHIVVTGASKGIGAAIVDALAAQGARISLMGRSLAGLEAKAEGLPKAQCIAVDVMDPDAVCEGFAKAREGFGPIDVLVNNAGQAATAPFHKMDKATWRQMMGVNLDSVFFCCQEAMADMRPAKSGRIINIASTAALKGYGYVSAYVAAKHGVLGLTRALAMETAQHGITVNAVCPGYTETELVRDSIQTIMDKTGRSEEDARAELAKSNPQGRLIQPEEVANTVLWLCQDGSDSITGQAIAVAGGEVM
ncbi:SDR family NAD(P)-dependent oxidoreductase [Pseudoteredinibacter isoporae]|uniref:NAD(P)-dependent dehydrogenase (Short-subunit alcohol dehydrogenase family) n=1 Tax=Pseudoteredinibacter isoporae TaxID=570281 RepID=A0A7X0MWW7_9GAMM|nr:SDR family NAD(P)-dependent oxidoreductase [Pseudoteredinibacter isoporae]MBB6521434.1 NAD(P)-dependent dehydrogenase (short-subunit alcohol dehydrogenase family) [Pseudoteredinibacter isoporae]NHO86988.1 SDR family oxidoreductase [Pseudoteredinibacter isoporae]NIB24559.1 SDR family oxidoreductase [Pseudoteredinibacter isoporae]